MAVHAIAYVELYTRDKVPVVDHLVSAFGFRRAADSVTADRSSILLRSRGTQLVVTSGRGVGRYLDEFGDGVANIALTCDDVTATARAAVAAGAWSIRSEDETVVSAFGNDALSHTLIGTPGHPGPMLPPGRRWIPTGAVGATGSAVAEPEGAELDHVGIGVAVLGACAGFYRTAFGLSAEGRDGTGARWSMRDARGNVRFELFGTGLDAPLGGQVTRYVVLTAGASTGTEYGRNALVRPTGEPSESPARAAGREFARAVAR
ncbi:hypothetical protein ACFZCK_29065 [Kitasatospora purpeofusca]|uniref:hypothetical protein n=1 Tax=Kitasatospora purpeofusca TaxID=67352 RepID=UPI0036E7DA67